MSFGYSLGDFVAGANLSYRLMRALVDSQGACIEYQEAINELNTIQHMFTQVSQMRLNSSYSQATINAASFIIISSMEIIGDFLERTKDYNRKLQSNGGWDSWRKIGWALFKADELKRLRDTLHMELASISVLLATANFYGESTSINADPGRSDKVVTDVQPPPLPEPRQIPSIGKSTLELPESRKTFIPSATPELPESRKSPSLKTTSELPVHSSVIPIAVAEMDDGEVVCQYDKIEAEADQNSKVVRGEVRALYDFEPLDLDELSFRKGDIITVLESKKQDWWKGKLNDSVGMFPLTHIEHVITSTTDQAKDAKAFKEHLYAAKLATLVNSGSELLDIEDTPNRIELPSDTSVALTTPLELAGDGVPDSHQVDQGLCNNTAEADLPEPTSLDKLSDKPIRYIDTSGRKFTFPYRRCTTWKDFSTLVDSSASHVGLTHDSDQYFASPTEEIILPSLWDEIIEPGWTITAMTSASISEVQAVEMPVETITIETEPVELECTCAKKMERSKAARQASSTSKRQDSPKPKGQTSPQPKHTPAPTQLTRLDTSLSTDTLVEQPDTISPWNPPADLMPKTKLPRQIDVVSMAKMPCQIDSSCAVKQARINKKRLKRRGKGKRKGKGAQEVR